MPDSFDQFPDASTALRDAHNRESWNVFPDARDAFQLQKAKPQPGVYPGEGPVPSVQWGPFTPGAVGGGMLGAGQRIGSLLARVPGAQSLGMPASSEFHEARANLEADRQAAGETWTEGLVRGATENLLPMALTSPAGVAISIAGGSAITADQAYETGKSKGLSGANLAGYVSAQAGAEALGEILPAKIGGSILTLMQKARKSGVPIQRAFVTAARSVAGDAAGEAGTQIVQNAIDFHAGVDPHSLDYDRLASDVGQAVAQSVLMGAAVTAPHLALSQIEERLANLKSVKSKGYVSAEDGQLVGISGETRKQRMANADAEIQQLEKETQNASAVPSPQVEVRQPESGQDLRGQGQNQAPAEQAGEVPQVRVEPPKPAAAPQAEASEPPPKPGMVRVYHSGSGGEGPRWVSTNRDYASNYRPDLPLHYMDLPASDPRVNNQDYPGQGARQGFTFNFELPAKEASQLTQIERPKPAEAQPPDERQANRDAIAAAEALVPPEQPKRDVSAEIRDALAQGPVTVSTPQVQSGFKVSKVRDDGRVVTKHGKIITPDETWVINPPNPAEAPAAATESKTPQIGSKLPDNAVTPAVEKPATQPEPIPPQEVVQPPQPVAPPKSRGLKEQAAEYGSDRPGHGAVLGQSAKSPGKWQVTRFDPDGFSGDTQYKSRQEAERELERDGYKPGGKQLESLSATDQFAKGNEKTQLIGMMNEGADHNTIMDAYNSGGLEAARKAPPEAKLVQRKMLDEARLKREAEAAPAEPTKPAVEKPVEAKPEPIPAKPAEEKNAPEPASQEPRERPHQPHTGEIDYREQSKGVNAPGVKRTFRAVGGDRTLIIEQSKHGSEWSIKEPDQYTGKVTSGKTAEKTVGKSLAEGIGDLRKAKDVAQRIFAGTFDPEADQRFAQEDKENSGYNNVTLGQQLKNSSPGHRDSFAKLLREKNLWTDGKLLVKVDNKSRDAISAKVGKTDEGARQMNYVDKMLEESKKSFKSGNAMAPFAYRGGDIKTRTVALKSADGDVAIVDKSYHDTILKHHPKAVPYFTGEGNKAVAYKSNGEPVALLMPIAGRGDAHLTALKEGKYEFKPTRPQQNEPAKKATKKPKPASGNGAEASAAYNKTRLQQAADDAVQEANAELESFSKTLKGKGLASNPILDPEVIAGAGRVVAKFVKAGTLKFAALMEHLAKSIGQAAVDRIRPALESEWDRLQKTDSSMEQRTPEAQAEPQPMPGDDLTSIKKEIVNEMREKVGLPEMEGSTPQTVEEWAENARITLAADPKAAIRLVNELAGQTSRPINQHDAMLLQFRYRQLENALKPAAREYFAAVDSGNPVEIATAQSALMAARSAMTEFEEIIHPSKETWGRVGVVLRQMFRKDMSIEAILRRGREANAGKELNEKQTVEMTALAKKFDDLQKQFDAERKQNEEREAELASKRQHEEAVTRVKQEKVRRKSGKREAAEKKVADAWEKFRQAANSTAGSSGANLLGPAVEVAQAYVELGYVHFSEFIASVRQNIPQADDKLFRQAWDQVNADAAPLDPSDRGELSKLARDIQRELVESGMTDRDEVIDAVHEALQGEIPDLTRRQTMDALSRYGIFQRQSQNEIEKLIRGMNSEILKLSQIDQMETAMKRVDELRAEGKTDEEIGKALDKEKLLVEATGLVRDRPSQTVRQLTQKYNELKKSIPATPSGKAGMLQTTLNQMERALKNRISDLRFEIDRREKVVKEKRERPTSETIKALEAERDSLVKIHKEMFPPKKPSEAQRIASAIRGSDKAIAQLEKQIAFQDFDVEARPGLSSPALDARRARLEQLRAARKALKAIEVARMEGEGGKPTGKVPLSDAELARRAYESSLRSRIADYQQLLAEGDFAPKPKKSPRTLTESELKLRREMEDVRHEVLNKYADYHLAHLKGVAWTADKLAEASRLSRALMTFVDLPLLRQGGVITAGRPIMAAKVMKNVVEEIAGTFGGMKIDSRQAEFNLMHKLREGPEGEFMQKSGLQLPSSDEKITRQEEAFQGRWAKWVPGVSLGGRLYTMIMNTLRVHEFRTLVDSLGSGGQATLSEGKLFAHFVNIAAGRSDLKGVPFLQALEQQAHLMNEVFFASRWVMSRFQLLALPGYLPFRGGLKNDWRAKRVIYKEMGRQMAGTAAVLGIVALAARMFWDDDDKDKPRVGVDPTSSDFLKIVMGESRIDLLYGLSQIMVLASRIGLQRTTSSVSGKTRKFGEGFEPETTLSTLERFGRTKLAPVPGAITTIANNWTNVVGQPETPLSLGAGLFAPVSLGDVYTTMKSERVPKFVALALIGELGASVSTYGPRTQYVTGNAEQRQAQIEKDLKNMHWDSPEQPPYSEFLTDDQLEQFRQRRQEKRGLVVYQATYAGKDEDEIKTRDKNREYLESMGVSKEESAQLLRDYYKSKEHGLRVHGGTGLKPGYVQKLRALNSIYGK